MLRRIGLVAGGLTVALAVLFLVLGSGGGITSNLVAAGLPDPGEVVTYGVPTARVLLDLLGALTVGYCVAAAFLAPGDSSVGPTGYRLLRRASNLSLAWAATALVLSWLTVAYLMGQEATGINLRMLWSFLTTVAAGQAYGVQFLLCLVLAVGCRVALSRTSAALLAALALIAVLPPAFTGHASGAGNHQIAVTGMAMHVAGAALWLGGLAALLALRADLATAARRYSRLALACFVLVALSGIANAAVRLESWDDLLGTSYGVLVLVKVAAFAVLGAFGAAHRRITLRKFDGRSGLFRRLVTGELLLFAAVFGLSVGLSRTPPPVPVDIVNPNRITELLGFPMPAAPQIGDLLGGFLPDLFFLALVAAGLGYYLAGVWRLRRNGVHWPLSRTVSWTLGMLTLGAVTNLGLAKYAYVLFSAHMMQHMLLSMLIPIMLVLGAPMTLALRALKPVTPPVAPAEGKSSRGGDRGPREWLLLALHSTWLKFFTHPVVALVIFVGSLYALYFSPLFAVLMGSHLGHLAMLTHFILAGFLFFWVIVGIDPGRRAIAHPVLILVHFGGMVFHAFFGVILMQARSLLANDWFGLVRPPWLTDPAADQYLGAGITWSFGEIPSAIVFAILVLQWIKADEREQRRLDRAADRATARGEEDELGRYNEYLKSLPKA